MEPFDGLPVDGIVVVALDQEPGINPCLDDLAALPFGLGRAVLLDDAPSGAVLYTAGGGGIGVYILVSTSDVVQRGI
jgi:hypothetical protein